MGGVCSFSSGEPQTHAAGDGRPLRPRGGGAPGADGVRGRQGHQRLGILRGQERNSADLLFLPHVLCGYHVAVMSAGGRREAWRVITVLIGSEKEDATTMKEN